MLSLLSLLLVFWDDGKSVQRVSIDDLSALHVVSIASHQDETLFITLPIPNGRMIAAEIWRVRSSDMSLTKLVDGRFGALVQEAAWVKGGFILRAQEQKIIQLGPDFKFRDMENAASFFKFDAALGDITYLSPYKSGQTMITLRKKGEFFLGLFDGSKMEIVAGLRPKDGVSVQWLYTDQQIFLLELETGKISLAGRDFLAGQTLMVGQEPVLKPDRSAKLATMYATAGLSPYQPALTCVLNRDSYFSLLKIKRREIDGAVLKEPIREYFSFNRKGRVKAPIDTLTIAQNKDKALVFKREDGIFEFQ